MCAINQAPNPRLSFVGWHWGLLEKWINTKADNKQALQSAVTFFKKFDLLFLNNCLNSVTKYFSKGFFVINDISNRLI
jgi:hypothetical protein